MEGIAKDRAGSIGASFWGREAVELEKKEETELRQNSRPPPGKTNVEEKLGSNFWIFLMLDQPWMRERVVGTSEGEGMSSWILWPIASQPFRLCI